MRVLFSGGLSKEPVVAPRFLVEESPPSPATAAERDLEGVAEAEMFDIIFSARLAVVERRAPDVVTFRSTHLPGGRLLDWEEVPAWMVRMGLPDLPPSARAKSEDDEDGRERASRQGEEIWFTYVVPGDARQIAAVAFPDTPLAALRPVVSRLTRAVPWTEPQATIFVLTDEVPLVTSLRVSTKRYNDLANLPRLVLEVDPRVSQRDLAAAYQAARGQLMPEAWPRPLSNKHLALALFGGLQEGREGRLAERMERWNTEHPEWSYTQTSNFARDMALAGRRLLVRETPPAGVRRGRRARRAAPDEQVDDGEE